MEDIGGGGGTHCYLLEGEECAVLIDTGLHVINIKEIVTSINTHGHIDHITNNFQFKTIYMHPKDDLVYQEHSSYEFRYLFFSKKRIDKGIPKCLLDISCVKEEIEKNARLPKQKYISLSNYEIINISNRELVIIETPEHTPGSICVLDVQKRRLYSGDT
jgi:glyoxylase-like metal-dependent hydrolase (beta-lactamase superfamily II)